MPDIWIDVDVAIVVPVNVLALIDDTDFTTRETGIVYDSAGMDLVWNFVTTAGVQTQTGVTPTTGGDYDWTHLGDAMYSLEIPASAGASINNNAEGFGWFSGLVTGVLPWRGPTIGFRAAGLNNLLVDSPYSATRGLVGTALPAASADGAGGVVISDGGGLDMDAMRDAAIRLTAVRAATLTDLIDGNRLDAIFDAINAVTTAQGATGTGLTAMPWNSAWDTEVESEVADALAVFWTSPATLVDLVWDEVISKAAHNIAGSAAKTLRQSGDLVQIDGVISDATPTVTSFNTDLTQPDDYFDDAVLIFLNGSANAGIGRPVSGYLNTNGNMTFDAPDDWPVTPVNGDDFIIYATHVHPVAQIQTGLAIESKQDTIITNQASLATIANQAIIDGKVDDVITTIGVDGLGLTDLGGMSVGMQAEVLAEVVKLLTTQMVESYAADGVVPTLAQCLLLTLQSTGEFGIVGTNKTVRRLDGSTTAGVFGLDDSSNPTDITRSS